MRASVPHRRDQVDAAIYVIGWANNALLVVLSVLSILLARRTRTRTGRLLAWAVVTFTVATLAGWTPWAVGEGAVEAWFAKGRLVLQIIFPYLLLRLAHAFRPFSRVTMRVATIAAIAIAIFVVTFPANIASPAFDFSDGIVQVFIGSYVSWIVVALSAVTGRFLSAGRHQPGSIRRRMFFLAAASVAMLLAYVTAFAAWVYAPYALGIASMLLVAASTIAFVLGVAPSPMLRLRWRRDEEHDLREAIVALIAAETRDDVLTGILPKVRTLVGASAVGLVDAERVLIRTDASSPRAEQLLVDTLRDARCDDEPGHQLSLVPFGSHRLALRTTPVTPLVGDAELELLAWVGTVVDLAFARCEHLAEDRAVTERLREVDRLKSEFVQIVAHDLRSPMTAVAGLADTLQTRWEDIDADTKRTMLTNIGDSTQRMSDLVVDVLDIALIESGELRYEITSFDMVRVVRQAVEDLELDASQPRIYLHIEDDVPAAMGDERRHRQVVANLLSNALKYSPEGARIDVNVTRDEGELVVGVRDRGDGIALDEQSRIFEKFGRAVSPSDATPGSGLGLFICKAMVESQGGRIWVESTPGEGATFRFTAPVASH